MHPIKVINRGFVMSEGVGEIVRVLYAHNPWWSTGTVPKQLAPKFRRRDFYKLKDRLESKEITGIVGARRVGKTTLMYQLIEELLQTVDPLRILYLKVDDPYLSPTSDTLRNIFDIYSINILAEPLETSDQIYVMLDEIQSIDEWELFLKRWYDLGYNIKFMISGSSSLEIMQRGAESLVGRFHPQLICPMKFLEVIRFQYKEEDVFRKYDQINWEMRKRFSEGIKNDDPKTVFDVFQWASIKLAPERDDIRIKLDDYLLRGGYPASVIIKDHYKTTELLRDYLSLTIYRDIVKIFNIRDPKTFESLFSILSSECCDKHNYSNLANDLGVKRGTIKDYLYYLTHSYLISETKIYSRNVRKKARNNKKIYINDNGLRNAVLGLIDQATLRDPIQIGKLVENTVADHCKRLKFSLGQGLDSEIFYWNNKKGQEVDIVIDLYGKTVPIEVKYRNQISKSDLSGIYDFKKEHESKINLVITKNTLSLNDEILEVPLWVFLIMC